MLARFGAPSTTAVLGFATLHLRFVRFAAWNKQKTGSDQEGKENIMMTLYTPWNSSHLPPSQKETIIFQHPFSGALLVSGRKYDVHVHHRFKKTERNSPLHKSMWFCQQLVQPIVDPNKKKCHKPSHSSTLASCVTSSLACADVARKPQRRHAPATHGLRLEGEWHDSWHSRHTVDGSEISEANHLGCQKNPVNSGKI